MVSKADLKPFARVKAKNGKFGILVIYNDSEIVCFEDVIIFLSRYNDDLTLDVLNGMSIDGKMDPQLREYRFNLLSLKDDYFGYEIVDIYEISNFNDINKVLNFSVVSKGNPKKEDGLNVRL